jgi:hypothetical protein
MRVSEINAIDRCKWSHVENDGHKRGASGDAAGAEYFREERSINERDVIGE